MRRPAPLLALIAVLATMLAACAGGWSASESPSPSPSRQPVTTEDQAIAAVVAHEPRLSGITRFDPDLIGQGTHYQVTPASGAGAFIVDVTVGWGDCPAGCIYRHTWQYVVGPDGSVAVQSEQGDPVPDEAWPSPGGDGRTGIRLQALAGPVCPVEQDPPDPACAPRPLSGAVIVVRDVAGDELQRVTLDQAGVAFVELGPGTYTIAAQPVEGLMGVPPEQSVTIQDGIAVPVTLAYDTGIR
ncbi:MAG: hypothetical protein ACLGIJ_13545 [Candidatus Limnocylindria bacterium]